MSCPGAARRGASVSRPEATGAHGQRFPRGSRLSARKSFLEIYERGQRVSGTYFVMFGLPGATALSRLGITATRKYGDAVARNRFKRRVREMFRRHRGSGAAIDLVVNARSAAASAPYRRLEDEFVARLSELARKVGA